MHFSQVRWLTGGLLAWLVLCLLVATPARITLAQPAGGYLAPLPIAEELRERQPRHNALKSAIRQHFLATSFDAQAQQDLRDWYRGYYFPAFTDPRNFADISKMRTDFIRSLTMAKSPELRTAAVTLAFSLNQHLCTRNFPPATRINAMLLIAELNQADRTIGSGGNPVAIPYSRALEFMREQLKDPDQIDGVRIAALGGILRHVETQWWLVPRPQINENVMREISQEMVALALDDTLPQGRSADGQAWIRSRAVDILGSVVALVPTDEAFEAMLKIAGDARNPTWLRVRASYALARVDYGRLPAAENIDKSQLAGHVASVLSDSCRLIVDRLEAERTRVQQRRQTGGGMMGGMMGEMAGMMGGDIPGMGGPDMSGYGEMMGGMMPGGMGGGGGAPRRDRSGVPAYYIEAAKRRLAYETLCVNAAIVGPSRDSDLKGLQQFTQGDEQAAQTVARIQQAVSKIGEIVKDDEIMLAEIVRDLRTQMQALDRFRPEPPPPPTPAPVAEEIPGEIEPAGDVEVPEPSAPLPVEEETEEDLPDEADVPEPELPPEEMVPTEEGAEEGMPAEGVVPQADITE